MSGLQHRSRSESTVAEQSVAPAQSSTELVCEASVEEQPQESVLDGLMSVAPQQQAPPEAPEEPAPAPPDPAQTRSRATSLYRAMDGWGTDEDAIMSTLRGLSAAEVAAVREEFQNHYGTSMDAMIESEMGGDDLTEAQALLTADPVEGVLAGLQNSLGTFNDDEDKIDDLMGSLTPEQRQQLVNHPDWAAIQSDVQGSLGGSDREVFDALSQGETSTAAAIRLDDAMGSSSSWYNPTSWGTDEDAVYEELGRLPPEQRAQVEARFDERMSALGSDSTLSDQLADELSGADLQRAEAVLSGNTVDEEVARLAQTMEGMGTNEDELFRLLEQPGMSPEQRQEIRDRYEEVHGTSLDSAVIEDLSSTDLERAEMAIEGGGAMDPAFMMYYAMEGAGTDEDLIRTTLQGMSSEQITEMRTTWDSTYSERYGATFDTAFEGELSGRDHFDIVEIGMRGTPQSSEERAEILELQYSYERGDRSTGFGRGYMDALDTIGFSSSASQMDRQNDRLSEMYDEEGNLTATPEEMESLFGQSQADMEDYRAAKDAATDALATAGEITVAALVTLATKGAASPWLVAVLAGVAGGATGMALRGAVQGEAYGREAIAADALKTALSAGFSGVMESAAVADRLAEIATNFGDDIAREVAEAAMAGGLNNMGTGMIDGAMNGDALRGGLDEYLLSIAESGGTGLVTGVVSGTAQRYTEGLAGEVFNRETLGGEMLTGAVSNASGGLASTAVNPGTYDGRAEDIAMRFGRAGGSGLASGGLNSAVSYQTRSRTVAREVLEGRGLNTIEEADHMSVAQRQATVDRLLASGQEVDPAVFDALGHTPGSTEAPLRRETEQITPAIEGSDRADVLPEERFDAGILTPGPESTIGADDLQVQSTSGEDDLQSYRETLVVQELIRLEELGDTRMTDQVLGASSIDEMEALLIRASGGGGTSDLAGIDASTPEGVSQVLIGAGLPQSQLDNVDSATLDAMARYSQAYSSGDLQGAADARAQMVVGLSEGSLALVEGALIANHYGMEGAEHVGLEGSARAAELLGDDLQATPAEMTGMQDYLGDTYDTYLQEVRANVPENDPRWSLLSEQELVAVYGYTTNDYSAMNGALRSLDPAQLQELMPYMATAQSGLAKLPDLGDLNGGPSSTQRGMDALSPVLSAQLEEGMTFTDNGFLSTSMTDAPLDLFDDGVQITVIGTSGVPVSDMSAHSVEQEALYPAGTSFTVVERTVDPDTGATRITLQEL